jgi:PhnB protein
MAGVPLPEGYHTVNPYIVVDGAERLIDFLVEVFDGTDQGRTLRPDGRIEHGDVRIGDSLVMLSEASVGGSATHLREFS